MLMRHLHVPILAACLAAIGGCGEGESSDGTGQLAGSAGFGGGPSQGGGAGSGNAGVGGLGAGGSGDVGSGGSGGVSTSDGPQDVSAESLAAFLDARTYQSAPWVAETPAPREGVLGTGSPHGRVRVYFNPALLDSIAAGNGLFETMLPHATGSMAVKELYDETDTQVGVAAELKVDGNFAQWAYYCRGPADRCALGEGPFTAEEPAYGIAGRVPCGICHGGFVFTPPP